VITGRWNQGVGTPIVTFDLVVESSRFELTFHLMVGRSVRDRTRVSVGSQSGTNATISPWAGPLGYGSAQSTYVRYRGTLPRPWMSTMPEEPGAYEFRYVLPGEINLDADSCSERET